MDIVCDAGEIVAGVLICNYASWRLLFGYIHTLRGASFRVCNTVFGTSHMCMLVVVRVRSGEHVYFGNTVPDMLCNSQTSIRAVCRPGAGCIDVYTLCVIAIFACVVQHIRVRPVLKHGPRSLTYMQVRSRDHMVHNKYNYLSIIICCRRTCLSEFEHEHMH